MSHHMASLGHNEFNTIKTSCNITCICTKHNDNKWRNYQTFEFLTDISYWTHSLTNDGCLLRSVLKLIMELDLERLIIHCGRENMAAIFADNIYICIFLNENFWISNKILLKYVPNMFLINNKPLFVQIMGCFQKGTNDGIVYWCICVNWPQRVIKTLMDCVLTAFKITLSKIIQMYNMPTLVDNILSMKYKIR